MSDKIDDRTQLLKEIWSLLLALIIPIFFIIDEHPLTAVIMILYGFEVFVGYLVFRNFFMLTYRIIKEAKNE